MDRQNEVQTPSIAAQWDDAADAYSEQSLEFELAEAARRFEQWRQECIAELQSALFQR